MPLFTHSHVCEQESNLQKARKKVKRELWVKTVLIFIQITEHGVVANAEMRTALTDIPLEAQERHRTNLKDHFSWFGSIMGYFRRI